MIKKMISHTHTHEQTMATCLKRVMIAKYNAQKKLRECKYIILKSSRVKTERTGCCIMKTDHSEEAWSGCGCCCCCCCLRSDNITPWIPLFSILCLTTRFYQVVVKYRTSTSLLVASRFVFGSLQSDIFFFQPPLLMRERGEGRKKDESLKHKRRSTYSAKLKASFSYNTTMPRFGVLKSQSKSKRDRVNNPCQQIIL